MDSRLGDTIKGLARGGTPEPVQEPWLGWLLVCLCRQRARQTWLAGFRDKLEYDGDGNDVPGLPAWTYYFHGRGLCMTGPNNEVLDVDFYDDPAPGQTIDPIFFVVRVRNLLVPAVPEARLRHWFPTQALMVAGLRELQRQGWLDHPESTHVFRLHARLEAIHRIVAQIDFTDPGTLARWGRGLGDGARCGEDEAAARDRFANWGVALLTDRSTAGIIEGLASFLPTEQLVRICHEVLLGPIDSATARALEALARTGLPPSPQVLAAARRMDPAKHHPYAPSTAARYLLAHGVQRTFALDLISRFAAVPVVKGYGGNPFGDEFALLMLQYAPGDALSFVRTALRSTTPIVYQKMAAVLSVLDEPWCREELLAEARRTNAQRKRFLVAYLMYSEDPEVVAEAQGLMPPPPESESAIGFSFEEVEYANLRPSVEWQREQARDVARSLRPN